MKTYRYSKIITYFSLILSLLCIMISVWICMDPFLPLGLFHPEFISVDYIPFGILLLLIMGYVFISAWRNKFVLEADKIYWVGTWKTQEIKLDEILGFKTGDKFIFIFSKDKKKIALSTDLQNSDEIITWLTQHYPDLDVLESKGEYDEIMNEDKHGYNVDARANKLEKAQIISKILNGLGVVIGLWTFLYPEPYQLAIMLSLAIPILCIFILYFFRGLVRLEEKKGSPYPSILVAFILPCMSVAYRALSDINLAAHNALWYPLAVMTILLCLISLMSIRISKMERKVRGLYIFLIVFNMTAYTYGALIEINCLSDESTPIVYQAEVLIKRESSGRTSSYYLTLNSWGTQKEESEVKVSKDIYSQIKEREWVNIYYMNGNLGIPWFEIRIK